MYHSGVRPETAAGATSPPKQGTVQAHHDEIHPESITIHIDPKEAAYLRFQEVLRRFEEATKRSTARDWPARVFGELHRLHTLAVRDDGAGLPPPMKEFVLDYVPQLIVEVGKRQGKTVAKTPEEIATAATAMIMEIAERVEADMRLTRYLPTPQSIDLSELARRNPNRISIFGGWISVCDSKGGWHPFQLPDQEGVLHKGGLPRVLVKILAGAPTHLIDAELPPNDIDIIVDVSRHDAKARASNLGADPNGIEEVRSVDLSRLLGDRDLSINSCFVGKDRLYFSGDAHTSAHTGKIWPLLSDARTLFGSEWFVHEGTVMLKNRGMMRVMKFVAEGKGEEFDFLPRNMQVDLGIYWLVLARKFFSKPQGGELLGRAYELGKVMGQVRDGESDVFSVLQRVHKEYPSFTFGGVQDEIATAKWKAGKLLRRFDLAFRLAIGRKHDWKYVVQEGDTTPYSVRLTPEMRARARAFAQGEQNGMNFHERKLAFLEECKLRNNFDLLTRTHEPHGEIDSSAV